MKNNTLLSSLLPNRNLVGTAVLAAAGLAIASSTLTAPSAQAFGISLHPQFGSTENTGAKALLDFKFEDTNQGVKLNLGIFNTTDGNTGLGATQATLVGVAFDLFQDVSTSAAQYTSGTSGFTQFWNNPSLPPYGDFGVGISPERNSFAGGNPQEGLTAGNSTLVSFFLSGTTGTAAEVETSFLNGFKAGTLLAVGRFQQVNAGAGSDKVLGGVEEVPEPTTMAGSAFALAALMKLRSRKASKIA